MGFGIFVRPSSLGPYQAVHGEGWGDGERNQEFTRVLPPRHSRSWYEAGGPIRDELLDLVLVEAIVVHDFDGQVAPLGRAGPYVGGSRVPVAGALVPVGVAVAIGRLGVRQPAGLLQFPVHSALQQAVELAASAVTWAGSVSLEMSDRLN